MINERPEDFVPELKAFRTAQKNLYQFKKDNPDFFEILQELVDKYQAAKDLAYKAVHAKGVSCGPFVLACKPVVKYDADKLYEEMGRDFFFAIGGKELQVTKYEIDKVMAEAALAKNQIPPEVVAKVRTVSLRYNKVPSPELP
jgi:hypothetical protein